MNKTVTATSGQTLIDLSLQLYGNADNILSLLALNPQIDNIHSDITGIEITYPPVSSFVSNFYASKGITVATKPLVYRNVEDAGQIISEDGLFNIVQENGYKILV